MTSNLSDVYYYMLNGNSVLSSTSWHKCLGFERGDIEFVIHDSYISIRMHYSYIIVSERIERCIYIAVRTE